jgi:hypothetical protein
MKTLVYFASGNYKNIFQNLPFDRIYLIDNSHKNPYPIDMRERERIIQIPIIIDARGREIDKRRKFCCFDEMPRIGDFNMSIIVDYKVQRIDFENGVSDWNIVKSNPAVKKIYKRGKVYCIEMDCLEAVEYFKRENIRIDCFVCLNEGLFEGGGYYPINSDKFMKKVNPILNENYIHLMKKEYYGKGNECSFDFMNNMLEIDSNNENYLSPSIFSDLKDAKVYQRIR